MSASTANARSRIKRLRRQIDPRVSQQCSMAMLRLLSKQRSFINSRHVAVYIPTRGEMSPLPAAQLAWQSGKSVYLPVLMPFLHNRLWFVPWHRHSRMKVNRYGIPEPVYHGQDIIPATRLDLVITPLVAFDVHCQRIGMGGGYYDRTFEFLRFRQHWRSPKLVGVAYEFQKITGIESQLWDVPLHAVITEQAIYRNGL